MKILMEHDLVTIKAVVLTSVGSLGAVARLVHEYLMGERVFTYWQIPASVIMGGFLGAMGGQLADVLNLTQWGFIFAGAFGSSGSLGFTVLENITKKQAEK